MQPEQTDDLTGQSVEWVDSRLYEGSLPPSRQGGNEDTLCQVAQKGSQSHLYYYFQTVLLEILAYNRMCRTQVQAIRHVPEAQRNICLVEVG